MKARRLLFAALLPLAGLTTGIAHTNVATMAMPSDGWIVFKIHLASRALLVPTLVVDPGPAQSMEGEVWIATADGSDLILPGYPTHGSTASVTAYYEAAPSSKAMVSTEPTGLLVDDNAPGPDEPGTTATSDQLPPSEPGDYDVVYVATSSFGRSWSASLAGSAGVTLTAETHGTSTFHNLEDDFTGLAHVSENRALVGAMAITDGTVTHEITGRLFGIFLAYSYDAGICHVSMKTPGGTLFQPTEPNIEFDAFAEFQGTPAGSYSFHLENCVAVGEEVRLWGGDVVLP